MSHPLSRPPGPPSSSYSSSLPTRRTRAQLPAGLATMRTQLLIFFSGGTTLLPRRPREPETPKTPRLNLDFASSTRLDLPHLSRTPPRNSPTLSSLSEVVSPSPTRQVFRPITPNTFADIERGDRSGNSNGLPSVPPPTRHARSGSERSRSGSGSGGSGSEVTGADPEETELVESIARRRRKWRRRQRQNRENARCCMPGNRTLRKRTINCLVSALVLILVLSIYLGLALSSHNQPQEFHVLLILIILILTIYFCHSLVSLCMAAVRPPHTSFSRSEMSGPGGYANPRRPIRVVIARDEEAAGVVSEESKRPPPAYGVWRESVRVDPDRMFWARNPECNAEQPARSNRGSRNWGGNSRADPSEMSESGYTSHYSSLPDLEAGGARAGQGEGEEGTRRPPSYISDDGVGYVVEVAPRRLFGAVEDPLPVHPAERGRVEWGGPRGMV